MTISPKCKRARTRKLCKTQLDLGGSHDQSVGFRVLRNHFRACPNARGIRPTTRRSSRRRPQRCQLPRRVSRRFTRCRLSRHPCGGMGRPSLLGRRQTLVWVCRRTAVSAVWRGRVSWGVCLQLPIIFILVYGPKPIQRNWRNRNYGCNQSAWNVRHLFLLEGQQLRRCAVEVIAVVDRSLEKARLA